MTTRTATPSQRAGDRVIAYSNIAMDSVFVLMVYFGFNGLIRIMTYDLTTWFMIAACMQVAVFAAGTWGVLTGMPSIGDSNTIFKNMATRVRGAAIVLALGSVFWLSFPLFAMRQLYGYASPLLIVVQMSLLFLLWVGFAAGRGTAQSLQQNIGRVQLAVLARVFVLGFFILAEGLMVASVVSVELTQVQLWAGIAAATISYLPIRLLFLATPPYRIMEFVTAIGAYAYFIYYLVDRA